MSETTHTNHSEDSETNKIPSNTAPDMKPVSGKQQSDKAELVIPVILVIVLAVVIVATFFEDEFGSMRAMPDIGDEAETSITQLNAMEPESTEAAIETMPEPPAPDTASLNPPADEPVPVESPAVNVSGPDEAESIHDAATASADPSTSPAPAAPNVPTSGYPVTDTPDFNPYYASPDFGTPSQNDAYQDIPEQRELLASQRKIWQEIEDQRRKDWEEMMERRRQAWLEADQARREHMESMLEYRTAVLKRIEKDREDMDRHIRQMEQEIEQRREQTEQRMLQFRRRADSAEI